MTTDNSVQISQISEVVRDEANSPEIAAIALALVRDYDGSLAARHAIRAAEELLAQGVSLEYLELGGIQVRSLRSSIVEQTSDRNI